MGSYTALQLAISYPEKVLGLFLVSPLSEVEVNTSWSLFVNSIDLIQLA